MRQTVTGCCDDRKFLRATDTTRVTLSGAGIDPADLLRVARSLSKVSTGEGRLTAPTEDIPCAQLANCK